MPSLFWLFDQLWLDFWPELTVWLSLPSWLPHEKLTHGNTHTHTRAHTLSLSRLFPQGMARCRFCYCNGYWCSSFSPSLESFGGGVVCSWCGFVASVVRCRSKTCWLLRGLPWFMNNGSHFLAALGVAVVRHWWDVHCTRVDEVLQWLFELMRVLGEAVVVHGSSEL